MSTSRKEIFLVGHENERITGSKLPSRRQVLEVLFFHMRSNNASVHKAAKSVFEQAAQFWYKARIPIRAEPKCIDIIKKTARRVARYPKGF